MKYIIILFSILSIAFLCNAQWAAGVNQPNPVDSAYSSPKNLPRKPMDAQFRAHNHAPWPRQAYTGSEQVPQPQGAACHVVGHSVGGKSSIKSYGELSKLRHPPQHTEHLSLLAEGSTISIPKEEVALLAPIPHSFKIDSPPQPNKVEEQDADLSVMSLGAVKKGVEESLPKLPTKVDHLSVVTVKSKTDIPSRVRDQLKIISKPLPTEPREPGQVKMNPVQLGKTQDKSVGVVGSTIAGKSSIKSFGNLARSRVSAVPPQN